MNRLPCLLLAGWLACCTLPPLRADVFVLTNGGRVEGELLNPDESPRRTYRVKTSSGSQITLQAGQVQRVERKSDALRWYEKWLPKMPNTAEGNWIMVQECAKRGLTELRTFHLQEVLKYDPDHGPARSALGYQKIGDRWVKTEQWMRDRGYVRYNGAWRLRQEMELEATEQQRDKEEIEWRRNVKMWRGWILGNRGRDREGRAKIGAIHNPAAAPVLADLLKDPKEPTPLKLLYIEVLSRLSTPQGEAAFIYGAMRDPDVNVRDRCLDQLAEMGSLWAVTVFSQGLQSSDNKVVNRAGAALGRLRRPEAVPALIDALNTTHKIVLDPGSPGRMSASFSPDGGGGGMSMGSKPKVAVFNSRNAEVQAALVSLAGGANFGYDEDAWKRWYADLHTPKSIDLRRGG